MLYIQTSSWVLLTIHFISNHDTFTESSPQWLDNNINKQKNLNSMLKALEAHRFGPKLINRIKPLNKNLKADINNVASASQTSPIIIYSRLWRCSTAKGSSYDNRENAGV